MIKTKVDLEFFSIWTTDELKIKFSQLINLHPDLFRTYLMGCSQYSVQFLTKNYSHLKMEKQICFKEIMNFDFYMFEYFIDAFARYPQPYNMEEIKRKKLTPLEILFCYICPGFFGAMIKGIFERRDELQLDQLCNFIQGSITDWLTHVSSLLTTYKLDISVEWLEKHPFNRSDVGSALLRYNFNEYNKGRREVVGKQKVSGSPGFF